MNKEKILQKVKDEVAQQFNLKSWDDLYWNDNQPSNIVIDEVANRYAIAMCEDQKIECLKNASAYLDANDNPIVADGSIINAKNVAE